MAEEGEIYVLDTTHADERHVRTELELMYIILSKLMPHLRIKDARTGKPLTITDLRKDAIETLNSEDIQRVLKEFQTQAGANDDENP